MTDAVVSRPGQNQLAGDERALMLDLFGGEVLTAFQTATIMRDKHQVKTLEKGKLFKFPAIWRTTVGYHTPGQEILGNKIPHTEIVVTPDEKLVSSVFVADIDEVMLHYDVRAPYAEELGAALARFYDKNVIRRIVQSARGGALFAGDQGGSTLTNANFPTDATVLFDGVSLAKETMDSKDVPVNVQPLFAVFRPAQWYLMARSDRNLNRDKNGGSASDRKHTLETIDEVRILKSNNTPFGVNDTANSDIPAKYRADFSKTVGVVWTPYAAATAEVQGLSSQVVDQPERQGTLMISRLMVGTDPIRTKCAVELGLPA
ncbi:hypothetical protein [Phenylobacterium sp.]|uniref:hypothetical protein n=1 Tax=Phenylobacterium sp. TaxID=1871053 RepID=UPI0039285779